MRWDRRSLIPSQKQKLQEGETVIKYNGLFYYLYCLNKDVLLEQMDMFIDKFNDLKAMLQAEDIDGMRKMMRHSTERRALFDKK